MNDEAIDRMLGQTWDDERLSRGERRSLRATLEEMPRGDEARQRFRHRAFLFAQNLTRQNANAEAVMGWLDDVVRALWPPAVSTAAGAPAAAYFSPDGRIHERIAALFDSARQRVDVCVFTITDDRISGAVERAHKRGVSVRVISDDDKAGDTGSDVTRLDHRGLDVRIDRSRHHMHHKFAIFDGKRLLNGSYNWTRSAAAYNYENVLLTSEPDLVRDFQDEFDRLWAAFD